MTTQNTNGSDAQLVAGNESETTQSQENPNYSIDEIRLWDEEVDDYHIDVIPDSLRIRWPGKKEVFRIREGAACEMYAPVIVDKVKISGRYIENFYFIPRMLIEKSGYELGEAVIRRIKKISLHLAMNSSGEYFIFPIILPDKWGNQSARDRKGTEAIPFAWKGSISIPYLGNSKYEIVQSDKWSKDLEWPSFSCGEIFEFAIRKALIDSHDHEVLRKIRGD